MRMLSTLAAIITSITPAPVTLPDTPEFHKYVTTTAPLYSLSARRIWMPSYLLGEPKEQYLDGIGLMVIYAKGSAYLWDYEDWEGGHLTDLAKQRMRLGYVIFDHLFTKGDNEFNSPPKRVRDQHVPKEDASYEKPSFYINDDGVICPLRSTKPATADTDTDLHP